MASNNCARNKNFFICSERGHFQGKQLCEVSFWSDYFVKFLLIRDDYFGDICYLRKTRTALTYLYTLQTGTVWTQIYQFPGLRYIFLISTLLFSVFHFVHRFASIMTTVLYALVLFCSSLISGSLYLLITINSRILLIPVSNLCHAGLLYSLCQEVEVFAFSLSHYRITHLL